MTKLEEVSVARKEKLAPDIKSMMQYLVMTTDETLSSLKQMSDNDIIQLFEESRVPNEIMPFESDDPLIADDGQLYPHRRNSPSPHRH